MDYLRAHNILDGAVLNNVLYSFANVSLSLENARDIFGREITV